MKPLVSMRHALTAPDLLGGVLAGESWLGWRVLLIAMMGEELTNKEREVFRRLTGRDREPLALVSEFWGIIGRRGGKSRAIATLVVYLATLGNHSANLVAGERGVCLVLAQNQKQARVVFNYVLAIIESVPALADLITAKSAENISLANGLDVEIRAASFRGLRGITAVACIADEISFWYGIDENSANPSDEILSAIRPCLMTTGGPLIAIGSPYARRGPLWETHQRDFGPQGDPAVLVAQAASREMNPTLSEAFIQRELAKDEASARAEYFAEFRTDIESFVSREIVEACVAPGVKERPPLQDVAYKAFVDPSGGSSDSMTLCIGHLEPCGPGGGAAGVIVVDAVRERRPPFSPEAVVNEFSDLLASFRVTRVVGDRYAGEWPRERFRERQIAYEPAAKAKSDLYTALLASLNSRLIQLPDDKRLVAQLVGLERRTARGGRDSIDHAPGSHDDLANVVAGLAYEFSTAPKEYDTSMSWVGAAEAPVGYSEVTWKRLVRNHPWFGTLLQ